MVAAARLREREAQRRPRPRVAGITGTPIHGGSIADLDQNAEVRGDKWIGTPHSIGIADKMIRDATVKRSHNSVIDPLVGAFWDVEPASDDVVDVEIADFVTWNLLELLPWERICERLLGYIRAGYSLHEVTADIRPISRKRFPILAAAAGGRAFVITGLHHRPANTVHEWEPSKSDSAQLAAVHQWGAGSDAEGTGRFTIPAEWLFRITWEQEGSNFAGYAPSRPQFGPWKAKLLCLVLLMVKHQKTAVPIPFITLPDGSTFAVEDEVAECEKILSDLNSHERGYAVLPGGFKIDWKALEGNIDETIQGFDQQIMLPFGSTYELLGNKTSGSHALAGTQKTTQNVSIERHASVIASAVNQGFDGWSMIERIVRPNYGPDVMLPTFRCRALPTRDWTEIFKHLRNLGEIGFLTPGRTTERFVRWVSTLPQESMPYVAEGFRARMGVPTNNKDDGAAKEARR